EVVDAVFENHKSPPCHVIQYLCLLASRERTGIQRSAGGLAVVKRLRIGGLESHVAAVSRDLPGGATLSRCAPDLEPAAAVRGDVDPLSILRPARDGTAERTVSQLPGLAAARIHHFDIP